MKQLLFSLVVFSILLIAGCQENSITDPNPASVDINKTSDSPVSGTIQLQGSLDNPNQVFNSFLVIDGEINYQITKVDLDPIPPNTQEIISVRLSTYAELNSICTVCMPPEDEILAGVISAETIDVINITEDSRYTITKAFTVQKNDNDMVFICSLLVTPEGITLDAMRLELIDHDYTAGVE